MQVDVGSSKKAIVVMVPFVQLQQYRKIQSKLVRELEKKFSGQHVLFVANRRFAVHLSFMCYPCIFYAFVFSPGGR